MELSAKTSSTSGLPVKPTLANLLAELLKRTDRAKYLMKDGFKLLAVLQPATRLNAQTSQDRWLCYVNGAAFIGLQLAACPYMCCFLSSLRGPGFGLKVQLAAIQQ
jgi:hypothetical protein